MPHPEPDPKTIYTIGDIHGCADELSRLLEMLPIRKTDHVVFLGDYIDRGPDSKAVLDILLNLQTRTQVVALMGNHEAMLLDFLKDPDSEIAGRFVYNGGSATLASYANFYGQYEFPEEHLAFLNRLQLTHHEVSHFFVHAGVPDLPLEEIDPQRHVRDLLWIREPFHSSQYHWSKIVVHGHTRVPDVDIQKNRINLDTGCVYGGKLSALSLPSGNIASVPRLGPARNTYLKDHSSRRQAIRFQGRLQVQLLQAGQVHWLETQNYSEIGMYLRDTQTSLHPLFSMNESISGKIDTSPSHFVLFQGVVVRVDWDLGRFHYAIRIEQLSQELPKK